jgi:hypothetical protein
MIAPLAADEDDIASWAATLADDYRLTRRLALERAWGIRVIRQLQIGFDGAQITIPIRDAHGALHGVCRYDPFGQRDPKMLAVPGTRLGLIPHPARIAQKYLVLVEGPPDMIAARTCGLAAIAVPGTSAWQPHWAELLRGRHVKLYWTAMPPAAAPPNRSMRAGPPPRSPPRSSTSGRTASTATTSPTASSNASANGQA